MRKKIMDSFRRILAEVGRNEMLMMGYTIKEIKEKKCFQGISLIFKIMGKKIVNSFKRHSLQSW